MTSTLSASVSGGRLRGSGGHAGSQSQGPQCQPERVTRQSQQGEGPGLLSPLAPQPVRLEGGPGSGGCYPREFLSVPPRAAHWPGLGWHGVRFQEEARATHRGQNTSNDRLSPFGGHGEALPTTLGGSGCPGAGGHEPPATASSSHGRSPPARTFIIELGPPGSPGWCHLEVLNSVTDMKPFSQIRARSQGLGGHGDLPLGTACNPLHPFYKKGSRGPGQPGWRCRVALGEGRGAPQAPAAAGGARTTPPSTAPPTPSWTPAPTCS